MCVTMLSRNAFNTFLETVKQLCYFLEEFSILKMQKENILTFIVLSFH